MSSPGGRVVQQNGLLALLWPGRPGAMSARRTSVDV
jgi:hypothetical protein